ncbi:MAG: cadherin domain-containing protein, partial [Bacteroidales bacterium]|nr:cadherin domain-containing protein [Bacteroidales bacterium]
SVRIRATDKASLYLEKVFTISITDVNEAPTNISLSAVTVDENVAGSTVVGTFSTTDSDAGEAFTYALIAGDGDTDNAAFTIVGNDLQINSSPDFEVKSSYSIRVQSADMGSLTIEKAITINVNNVNEEPSAISLTGNSVNENVAENSVIGTLATTDPDAGDTFTYTLVAGDGDTDNASFNIDGANLRITSSPDFEAKSSYSVRVRATDAGGLWVEETFTVSITNINESPTAIALSKLNVDENVSINTTVGALTTTDPDAFSIVAYSLVSGDGDTDNASFRINGTTLQITVSPDFEAKSSYSVRIRTTDQGDLWYEQAFAITVNNVNEAPLITSMQSFSIAENLAVGAVVGNVLATDPDAGTTFNDWSITQNVDPNGNGTPAFAIDAVTGLITVADAGDFDREATESVDIKVTVSDGSLTSAEENVQVIIIDVNDVAPVIVANQKLYIEEQSLNGTTIGTVSATDADLTPTVFQAWTITAGNEGGFFAINSSTGEITVVDNSGLDPQVNSSFTLVLTVSDGVNVSAAEDVTIIVSGINDDSPTVTPAQVFTIDENSAFGTLVGTVLATDPDVGTNFQGWTILSGNTSDAFSINAYGEIAVSQPSVLDYETVPSFTLTIQVSDGVHTADGEVTVNLNNLNDNAPVVTPATFALDENSANGTVVGTVTATDPDGTLNALAFSITAGNTADAFAIDPETGELTVSSSNALDFETSAAFVLTVQATDGTNSSDATVTINLNNLNDNAPVVTPATFALDENSANATVVGTVVATDADGSLNALAYTITAGNTAGGFAINETTGELTVNSSDALDFETAESFALTVQVSDGTNAADATVTINLNNVNDNTPVVTPATFALDENSANGTVVGTINATDADGTLNALAYSITAGNTANAFAINSETGELTVGSSNALDFETVELFTLTVLVSDGFYSADATVAINLNNLNDNAPVVTPATFALDENSANGTVVGTVTATDADGTLNALAFSITAGNTADAFAINSETGELTVNSSTALDYETAPLFTLTVSVSDGSNDGETTITVNLNNVVETGIFETRVTKLSVYPNPASDRIFFKLDEEGDPSGLVEIVSTTGAKVLSVEFSSSSQANGISVRELKKGAYILRVITLKRTYSQLIVVN